MNQELRDLFVADQAERRGDTAYDTPEYWQMRERDAQRRQRGDHGRRDVEIVEARDRDVVRDVEVTALRFEHRADGERVGGAEHGAYFRMTIEQ